MMNKLFPLLLVLVVGISFTMGCAPGEQPIEPVPGEVLNHVDLPEPEQAKLDPLLRKLLAAPDVDVASQQGIEALSEIVSIHSSGSQSTVDVLIKTTDKAKELSDLGIGIQARIGDIVTANLPIEQLPQVARLASVVYIEVAKTKR